MYYRAGSTFSVQSLNRLPITDFGYNGYISPLFYIRDTLSKLIGVQFYKMFKKNLKCTIKKQKILIIPIKVSPRKASTDCQFKTN